MFSLRESDDGKFIYRCHECGLESEIMGPEPANAAEQAIAHAQSHTCAPKHATPAGQDHFKAS